MKALTAAEMREVDRITIERHEISGLQLMENAGRHVSECIRNFCSQLGFEHTRRVAVLCGKGNNGGDGFVVARRLQEEQIHLESCVYLFAPPQDLRGDAAENYKKWRESSGATRLVNSADALQTEWQEIAKCEIIVDALLGTGLSGPAKGLFAKIIEDLNELSGNATVPR